MLDLSGMKRPLCDGHVKVVRDVSAKGARGRECRARRRSVGCAVARRYVRGDGISIDGRGMPRKRERRARCQRVIGRESRAYHEVEGHSARSEFRTGVVRRCGTCARACELPRRATRHAKTSPRGNAFSRPLGSSSSRNGGARRADKNIGFVSKVVLRFFGDRLDRTLPRPPRSETLRTALASRVRVRLPPSPRGSRVRDVRSGSRGLAAARRASPRAIAATPS